MLSFSKLLHQVASDPWVYDQIQMFFGCREIRHQLAPHLINGGGKIVIDIGAGTGLYRVSIPQTAHYIWSDIDQKKLKGFRRRKLLVDDALLGGATQLCMPDQSVDIALCVNLLHHLPDAALKTLWCELARVVREKVVFVEPLHFPDSIISRMLWRYDRGSFPRSLEDHLSFIKPRFSILQIKQFKTYHHFALGVLQPK